MWLETLYSGSVLFTASRTWFMGLSVYPEDRQTRPQQDKQLPPGSEMLMHGEICRFRDSQVKVGHRNQTCHFPFLSALLIDSRDNLVSALPGGPVFPPQ